MTGERGEQRAGVWEQGLWKQEGWVRIALLEYRPLGLLLALIVLGAPAIGSAQVADPYGFKIDVVARGLAGPVALAAAPDGRIFVAERQSGRIRVIENRVLLPDPLVTLTGVSSGERGLLGLAADRSPTGELVLYAYHTPGPERARIVRITFTASGDAVLEPLIDDLPAAPSHNGGALAIGPDRHLYFSIGDLGDPEGTIPPASRSGRIHRIQLDGTVPEDNPWPGRTEFCRGVRNCFGLSFLPNSSAEEPVTLIATDNGRSEDDEVNRVRAGAHLGWPEFTGVSGREDRVDPIRTWSPTTAPVGVIVYDGGDFPDSYRGDLFFGEYLTGHIVRLGFDAADGRVVEDEIFLDRGPAPVYALAVAPDGSLWFTAGDSVWRVSHSVEPSKWIRGDIDGNHRVERTDVFPLLEHLRFRTPLLCPSSADLDGNGRIDYADAVTLLLYLGGELLELPAPFPECGWVAGERLACPTHPACP